MLGDLAVYPLRRALDLAAIRHDVISHNIANADTPGFKRQEVSFDSVLSAAYEDLSMIRTNPAHLLPVTKTGSAVKVREISGSVRPDGNNVTIETEMARLGQNTMYYQAVSAQLGKYFGRLRTAISGRG
jgi:flagellar basal-body rod protein FlgB